MAGRIFGMFMLCLGTILVCWIGYKLFVERLPETRTLSVVKALFIGSSLLYMGYEQNRTPAAD